MKSKFLPFLLLLAVLPVLIFRDYTPSNELRYLSIVDEALRNGDIFTFTNHGIQYADKPPLYFWILMLGKWLLGNHAMWFASLFSFIPALVILLGMENVRCIIARMFHLVRWCLLGRGGINLSA